MAYTLDAPEQLVRDSTTNEIVGFKDSTDGEVRLFAKIPTPSALPTAGVAYRGLMYFQEGGAGVVDSVVCCMKGNDDNYDWISVAVGQTV